MSQPLIQIQNLNYAFGEGEARKQILFDINLEFVSGEVIVITGPSGSGKTTLLTLIGALRTLQEGRLNVLGRKYEKLSADQLVVARREIGFIFQLHNLFDSLTAIQNVQMPMDLKKWKQKEKYKIASEALTMLGLKDRLHYKPAALSGGQRQRVAVARALVNRPSIILADEPTAALDNETGKNVINLLRSIARESGGIVLIVSHDSRVLDFTDRIVNIVDGRIASDIDIKRSMKLCQYLMKSKIFTGLTPAEITEVAYKMTTVSYKKGEVIIKQGEEGEEFYIIEQGDVTVKIDGKIVTTLHQGDFLGEAALLTDEPRNATCIANNFCTLHLLDKEDFQIARETCESLPEQLIKVFFKKQ